MYSSILPIGNRAFLQLIAATLPCVCHPLHHWRQFIVVFFFVIARGNCHRIPREPTAGCQALSRNPKRVPVGCRVRSRGFPRAPAGHCVSVARGAESVVFTFFLLVKHPSLRINQCKNCGSNHFLIFLMVPCIILVFTMPPLRGIV